MIWTEKVKIIFQWFITDKLALQEKIVGVCEIKAFWFPLIPMLNIRRSWDRLIFNMGIPIARYVCVTVIVFNESPLDSAQHIFPITKLHISARY